MASHVKVLLRAAYLIASDYTRKLLCPAQCSKQCCYHNASACLCMFCCLLHESAALMMSLSAQETGPASLAHR